VTFKPIGGPYGPANCCLITPRPVILIGTRPFDGTPGAPGDILVVTNNIDGGNLTIAGLGTLISPEVGNEPIISFGTLALGGPASGDYTFTGGSGVVLVTPVGVPNFPTRRDQTVAGEGSDPYAHPGGMNGGDIPQPGENGLAACIPDSWYVDPTSGDGHTKMLCRPRANDWRGIVTGTINRLDVSGYLIKAKAEEFVVAPDTVQRRHQLYHQLRGK
jgi:hypothetical protein